MDGDGDYVASSDANTHLVNLKDGIIQSKSGIRNQLWEESRCDDRAAQHQHQNILYRFQVSS